MAKKTIPKPPDPHSSKGFERRQPLSVVPVSILGSSSPGASLVELTTRDGSLGGVAYQKFLSLSDYLRDNLNQRGWSQSDLARRGKLSTSQISKWISRSSGPDFLNCMKMALAFKDNPIDVLILAEHAKEAELLKSFLPDKEQRDEIPLHKELRKELEEIIEVGDEKVLEAMNTLLSGSLLFCLNSARST